MTSNANERCEAFRICSYTVQRYHTGVIMKTEKNDELQVGVITQTHGIRGEVKVFPTTDDPNRFKKLKEVTLAAGKERLPMEIECVKFFKQ